MVVSDVDRLFTGSIPQLYDEYMVPLIFEPYAADLASCVAMLKPACLPDKPKAFSEAKRVLRPGGTFIFNVWDAIDQNEFAEAVTFALQEMFPADPPRFMARTPHGYSDTGVIARHLAEGGFTRRPVVTTLAAKSRSTSPNVPAIAYCQGTLLRSEIETRDSSRLIEATNAAVAELGKRFGHGAVEGKIQAHIVVAER